MKISKKNARNIIGCVKEIECWTRIVAEYGYKQDVTTKDYRIASFALEDAKKELESLIGMTFSEYADFSIGK